MRLSIAEAMAYTGRSRATLYRWRSENCDITSAASLKEYSDHSDMRARGKSFQLALDRTSIPSRQRPPSILGLMDIAGHVSVHVDEFNRRLASAVDEDERYDLAAEIRYLEEARRLIAMVADGYR